MVQKAAQFLQTSFDILEAINYISEHRYRAQYSHFIPLLGIFELYIFGDVRKYFLKM